MDTVNLLANNNASFAFSRVLTPWATLYPLDQGKFRAQMRRTPTDSIVYYEWSTDNAGAEFSGTSATGSISFTGNPRPQLAATGSIVFAANPVAGATISLGATAIVIVSSGATGNEVNVAGSVSSFLSGLLSFLSASTDPQISLCTYTVSGSDLAIKFKGLGEDGNSFPISTTVTGASVSGPQLTGGVSSDITLGTSRVAFVASGAVGNQVNVGVNLSATLAALLARLTTSADPQISQCTYSLVGSGLNVSFRSGGSAGNNFALATSVVGSSASSSTLSGAGGVITLSAPVSDVGNFDGTYWYDCRFEYGPEFIPLFGGTITWQQGVTRT